MEHTYAVIMAGGVGSRFWPASRAESPKQLLDLTGRGRTMIAATLDRLQPDIPPERVIVVTGKITVDAVARALPEVPRENILAEPQGRNTAPCIGWAALHVKNRDPQGVMAVMPSDHLVGDKKAFLEAVRVAVKAAQSGRLVTFGVRPDHPETGFGYIEIERSDEDVRHVVRFVEKPDLETAKRYVAAGNFVWNSGMFFFTAERILAEMERQMPELRRGLSKIDEGIEGGREEGVLAEVFPKLPAQSIDYGVMEGAEQIACVPVDFGWNDLGSWSAAYDMWEKDENGNALEADAVLVDSKGLLVRAPKDKVVALVGVENLVVVDTGDSLLICRRDRAQDVKKVVDALKEKGRTDLL